ncbi:Uncharacterised protein [Mycobacteroides abscessus subsp. abscessus]|nr:Uncharacterised protein [Mycobacteroides abscessus subsp. abscessus]
MPSALFTVPTHTVPSGPIVAPPSWPYRSCTMSVGAVVTARVFGSVGAIASALA